MWLDMRVWHSVRVNSIGLFSEIVFINDRMVACVGKKFDILVGRSFFGMPIGLRGGAESGDFGALDLNRKCRE